MEWLKQQEGVSTAKSWSGKARMLPDKDKEVELVKGRLIGIQRQIRRKILRKFRQDGHDVSWMWALGEWSDGIEESLGGDRWAQIWDHWASSRPEVLVRSEIAPFYHKLRSFVVSPVDKHQGEGLIM